MSDSSRARGRLAELITELAIVRGKVTLSSGQEADWYVDLRRITLVGRLMRELTADWAYDVVGGLTLGADPIATAMLHAAAAAGDRLDACVVRKEGKAHGLQRRVEGPGVQGRSVLAVEDTSTTGGSVLAAVEALRDVRAEVVGIALIIDRGAGPALAATGLPYRALFSLADLNLAMA
jgi:orotate phosphoribosyltransferase